MSMTDPIADMLTRIRNINLVRKDIVEIPFSRVKNEIAQLLLTEGFIKSVKVEGEGKNKKIIVEMKYVERERVISGLKRISKPGLRVYVGNEDIPKVLNGLGVAIMSTNQGIMTDEKARRANVGGEVIAYVW
jgi:small subunit ribosomal protein S8